MEERTIHIGDHLAITVRGDGAARSGTVKHAQALAREVEELEAAGWTCSLDLVDRGEGRAPSIIVNAMPPEDR